MRLATLTVLSDAEVKAIHAATLDILEHCGVKILSPRLLSLLKEKGIRTDGERRLAFFKPRDVEDALATVPARFEVFDRDGRPAFTSGTDGPASPRATTR